MSRHHFDSTKQKDLAVGNAKYKGLEPGEWPHADLDRLFNLLKTSLPRRAPPWSDSGACSRKSSSAGRSWRCSLIKLVLPGVTTRLRPRWLKGGTPSPGSFKVTTGTLEFTSLAITYVSRCWLKSGLAD